MRDLDLFQLALGVSAPWFVQDSDFDAAEKRLDIHIDFRKGGRFPCPQCGQEDCPAYDTEAQAWRHLNFFQYVCYLHVRTPRVRCPQCGIKRVAVPWGRGDSGFTLLFEAFVLALAREMPVKAIARLVGEHDTRLWRVVNHYVDEAREGEDFSAVRHIGVDETSRAKGHDYITVVVDLEQSRAIFATPGNDAETIERFRQDLVDHGGMPDQIREVCCDMSRAYIAGVETAFDKARITFDKFHLTKVVNDAVDQVRRQEAKDRPELRRTRYLWLKNPQRLSAKDAATLDELLMTSRHLKTARAYQLRLAFQDFYSVSGRQAEAYLRRWCAWAARSRLKPMIQAARTIRAHWDGVLRWFRSRINNGILEAVNSLIQAAKAKARGYRSTRNLISIVYLIAGKLKFALPT